MKVYKDCKDDSWFILDGFGFPVPVSPEKAFHLITEEGYTTETINEDVKECDIDIEKIKQMLEEMEEPEPLTAKQERTIRFLEEKRSKSRKDLTDYYSFAANTKIDIPYAELSEDTTFIQKGLLDTLGYQIKDNLYLFQIGSRFYYGHLLDNGDYYHFIGVSVPDKEEQKLMELIRVDFNIKNGTLI